MPTLLRLLAWGAVAATGAIAVLVAALHRGESINALWLVTAGLCTFAIAYRFYSKWLTVRVLVLDERRAPPSITQRDGKDFVPTNRWWSTATTSRPLPGRDRWWGPVLAAQFGYLPGMLWILIGATLGGASTTRSSSSPRWRRCGKSLGQMLKEEVNPIVGIIAMISLLASHDDPAGGPRAGRRQGARREPVGAFHDRHDHPLAMTMGVAHTLGRVSVRTVTVFGVAGLLASVWAGGTCRRGASRRGSTGAASGSRGR